MRRPARLLVIAAIATLLSGATTVALAARASKAEPAAATRPAAVGPAALTCTLSGPKQGLEMNTVVADRFFKTVAMEKEIFVCGQQGGGTTQIRDVETFIEIVENASGGLVGIPTFLLSTCVSNPPTGQIRCKNTVPPTNPVNATPLQGCQVATFNEPDDPVVMNTAVNNGVVKTIKVDKFWYTCDTPNGLVIQDIYLFNEILERASKNAAGNATLAPYARRIIGVECTKHPTEAIISSCNLFPVK